MKLQTIMDQDLGYNPSGKAAFHKAARRLLREVASQLGLSKSEFTIRSNEGGIAVSGDVTLHADSIYISIEQRFGGSDHYVLYRSCKGQGDYSGGCNNYMSVEDLESGDSVFRLQRVLQVAA